MRLRLMAEAWMEAFALGSAILVPLFFNPYSARMFGGDKACLLYLMAIGIAVSLGLRILLGSDAAPRTLWDRLRGMAAESPLLGFVAVFLTAWFLSQVFSISPGVSFHGSYYRMQGSRTTLACACILAGMLVALRSPRAVDRFVLAVVFTSVPVVVCGILQRANLDPDVWRDGVSIRATGTMGNPIFLGAWLNILFFITLSRAWIAVRDARAGGATRGSRMLAGGLILAGIGQLVCLYLAGSRGPFVATGAGAALFAGFLLVRRGQRKPLYALLAGGAILAAGILLAGGAVKRYAPAESNFIRLMGVADTESGSSKVRLLMWKAAAQTVFTTEPLAIPGAGADRLAWLRPLIGFGPETIASVIQRNYEPELDRLEAGRYIDQCHNATWDLLITHGIFGTLAFFALVGAGVAAALARLTGTRFTPGRVAAFAAIVGGSTLFGAFGSVAIKDASYLGLGAGGGFVTGLLLALPYAITFQRRVEMESEPDRRWPLFAGLAAALVAHFVEIQFSVPTISTTLYLWIVLGLLCVESRNRSKPEVEVMEHSPGGHLVWGLIGSLALVSIGFSFCVFQGSQQDWQGLLRHAMGPMAVCLAFCVPPALYLLSPDRRAQRHGAGASGLFRGVIAEIGPGILALTLVVVALSILMARLSATVPHNYGDLLMLAKALGSVGLAVTSLLLLFVLAMGAVLSCERPIAAEQPHPAWVAIGALFLGFVLWIPAQHVSFMPIQADMCLKQGQDFLTQDHPYDASGMFLRAMTLAPDEELYAEATAQTFAKIAFESTSETDAVFAIREAIKHFEYALALNPSRPEHHMNLSRAYAWWSGVVEETKAGREAAQLADSYMEQGLRLAPRQHELWEERAQLNMGALGRPNMAESYLRKAMELAPDSVRAHELMGEFLGRSAAHAVAPARRKELQRSAVQHFEIAMRSGGLTNASYAHRAVARLHLDLGNRDKARENAEKALAAATDDDDRRLAELMLKNIGDAGKDR